MQIVRASRRAGTALNDLTVHSVRLFYGSILAPIKTQSLQQQFYFRPIENVSSIPKNLNWFYLCFKYQIIKVKFC